MKMKRVALGFSILAASTAFILSCTKEPNEAPTPDTETQSAVYASYANFIASDIDQICSFLGENLLLNHFYMEYPGTSSGNTGTMTAIRDTNVWRDPLDPSKGKTKVLSMAWNKTKCMDGVERDGTIFMFFNEDPAYPNAKYTRDYKFEGKITFSNYKVNGWLIELSDPANPMRLLNTLPTASYSPTSTNLTWKIIGKLKMTHPTDPNKNMLWETQGLTKTLLNTNNPKVFNPSKQAAITWSLGVVAYEGKVFGNCPRVDTAGKVTEVMAPFTMTINPSFALTRDFTCYPTKVSGVVFTPTPGVLVQRTLEHHPFNKGMTTFTVSTAYPRQIYYGNEGNTALPAQCDNTGEVLIKGNSYPVNFFN